MNTRIFYDNGHDACRIQSIGLNSPYHITVYDPNAELTTPGGRTFRVGSLDEVPMTWSQRLYEVLCNIAHNEDLSHDEAIKIAKEAIS